MSPHRALPNFLIIGAAKSGTTTLFDILTTHPQVFHPFAKEPKFFNNDRNYARGVDWYLDTFFRGAGKFPLRGEATPHYLYWGEKVSARIQQTFGPQGVKFVLILRDPVRRAYSQYWMDVQREIENLPFPEALAAEADRLKEEHDRLEPDGLLKYGYFRGGCYASLLEPFLQRFPPRQFHYLLSEDLGENFPAAMQSLAEFLGLPAGFEFQPKRSNPSQQPRSSRLHHFLLAPSGPLYRAVRRLLHLLPESGRHRLRRRIVQANLRPASYPDMDAQVERSLRERYQPEIERLEALIQRDLGHWKAMKKP